jgi:hypothetical protein
MGWWWEGMCLEGSPESEVHKSIAPLPEEKVIFKHRYSAFYNTDLETVLRCLKIEDLVIWPGTPISAITGYSSRPTAPAVSLRKCIWPACSTWPSGLPTLPSARR